MVHARKAFFVGLVLLNVIAVGTLPFYPRFSNVLESICIAINLLMLWQFREMVRRQRLAAFLIITGAILFVVGRLISLISLHH